MKVIFAEKRIEITKAFSDKASHFGSQEYHALRVVMNDLPEFQIVVKSAPKRQSHNPHYGMTYSYMEAFIAAADPSGSAMEDFEMLRRMCNFFEVRKWFIIRFPESRDLAA